MDLVYLHAFREGKQCCFFHQTRTFWPFLYTRWFFIAENLSWHVKLLSPKLIPLRASLAIAEAITKSGHEPYIGYLHASRYGKPALALDLMEEFRPLIVDSVVLNLFNNHQLEAKDFITELNACRMSDTTKRLFLEKFEERMQETITHPTFDYKVPYRRCIELQGRLLGKYLIGEIETYTPFTVR